MTKVTIYVTLRESVVDPQGIAAEEALHALGYDEVQSVRVGKLIELELEGSEQQAEERAKEMCDKLLVNRVIEEYRVVTGEVAGQ